MRCAWRGHATPNIESGKAMLKGQIGQQDKKHPKGPRQRGGLL
jgi:hypothetical protein